MSLLERCPHFKGVLREGFHCTAMSLVFQGMQELFLGETKGVLISEVSSFQGCP